MSHRFKVLKGDYVSDYTGDYCGGYEGGYLEFRLLLMCPLASKWDATVLGSLLDVAFLFD